MRYEGSGTTTESASAMAYFYEPVPPGDFALQPIDTCVTPVPVSSPAPTPAPLNYYDAGSEVTLSGASSIPLPKTVNGEFLYYLPAGTLSPASVPANGTWSVSWTGGPDLVAGSLSNAVELPASFVFSSPSFATAVTLSGAINLAWSTSGSAPGDAVWIYVSAGSGSATCRVTDDGAFTIPSSIIASLPSGSGVLGGYRIRSNEPVLPNGTRVFTYGMWSHYGAATKP